MRGFFVMQVFILFQLCTSKDSRQFLRTDAQNYEYNENAEGARNSLTRLASRLNRVFHDVGSTRMVVPLDAVPENKTNVSKAEKHGKHNIAQLERANQGTTLPIGESPIGGDNKSQLERIPLRGIGGMDISHLNVSNFTIDEKYLYGLEPDPEENMRCRIPVEEFEVKDPNMNEQELRLCLLKYVMTQACNLPVTACPSCKRPDVLVKQCFEKVSPVFWSSWVLLPGLVLLVHMSLSPMLAWVYWKLRGGYETTTPFEHFVFKYVGTETMAPQVMGPKLYLLILQVIASAFNVMIFSVFAQEEFCGRPWELPHEKTQKPRENTPLLWTPWGVWIQPCLNVQMAINFMLQWLKTGFHFKWLFGMNSLIDHITVYGPLIRLATYKREPFHGYLLFDPRLDMLRIARPMLNLHYLRAYRCLSALLEIQDLGAMKALTEFQQQLVRSSVRLFALVVLCAGAIITFEWVGFDIYRKGGMKRSKTGECASYPDELEGNIACSQFSHIVYWIFTTISTVGYGDFTPKSSVGMFIVIFIIVCGVTFFTVESGTLVEVMQKMKHGYGKFDKRSSSKHVIITGGAVRDIDAVTVCCFIRQILHRNHAERGFNWPDKIVLLGSVNNPSLLDDRLAAELSGPERARVIFVNGDPLAKADLRRALADHAAMVYVLPNMSTQEIEEEDTYNIQVAASVSMFGDMSARFRLLVIRPSAVTLATQCGLERSRICSLFKIKSAIFAQTARVQGWVTLLNTLISTTSIGDHASATVTQLQFPMGYLTSLDNTIMAFALHAGSAGKTFSEIAVAVYNRTGALPFCAQIEGVIRLFPADTPLEENTVIFCITHFDMSQDADLKRELVADVDWPAVFLEHKKEFMKRVRSNPSVQKTQGGTRSSFQVLPHVKAEGVCMETMQSKADSMVESAKPFCLVVVLRTDKVWQLLRSFVQVFDTSSKVGGQVGLVVLLPEAPPASLVTSLEAERPDVPLAFVEGSWQEQAHLESAGVRSCASIIMVSNRLPSSSPEMDGEAFLFLKILRQIKLQKRCTILMEMSSGDAGVHMLPPLRSLTDATFEDHEASGENNLAMEFCYSPWFTSGQVFTPHVIVEMLAKSYYAWGLLEVVQALTGENSKQDYSPLQVELPEALQTTCPDFQRVLLSLLEGSVGPCPALLLGIVRNCPSGKVTLCQPNGGFAVNDSDLLIVLANHEWSTWASEQGIVCMSGVVRETSPSEAAAV